MGLQWRPHLLQVLSSVRASFVPKAIWALNFSSSDILRFSFGGYGSGIIVSGGFQQSIRFFVLGLLQYKDHTTPGTTPLIRLSAPCVVCWRRASNRGHMDDKKALEEDGRGYCTVGHLSRFTLIIQKTQSTTPTTKRNEVITRILNHFNQAGIFSS